MLAPFQLWERMQSSGMRFTKSWNGASLRAVIAVARRHDATLREIRRMRRCGVASWCQVALCALSLLAGRAEAQVDPSGRWRTLHTEHFRIHFRPAYRAVAEQEAREAERAYRLLAGELRAPRGVIDFVLGDDVDVANGATTVFPSNRVYLWLPPPVGDPGLERFDSWLRLVTVHELTHVFHLDRVRGAWGVLQRVFGRAAGDSVVPRFVEATAGQLIPFRVGRQLGRAGPGRELREDWARATRPEVPAGAPGDVLARDLWSEPAPQLSPDGGRVAYQRDDGKGARQLVVVDMRHWRVLRHHRVNAGVSYDWLGDTLVVAQLDWTSRWRLRSDLYRWLPDGGWRRDTRGARLLRPRAGGARLAAIRFTAAAAEPTLPPRAHGAGGRVGGRGAVARRPVGRGDPQRPGPLGPAALARRLAPGGDRAPRDGGRDRRSRLDRGRRAAVRGGADRLAAGVPLERFARGGAAYARAAGRARPGGAARRQPALRDAVRPWVAAIAGPPVGRGRAGRRARAVRFRAAGHAVRDRGHRVAVPATPVLAAVSRERRSGPALLRRGDGREGRGRAGRPWGGAPRLARPAARRGRVPRPPRAARQ